MANFRAYGSIEHDGVRYGQKAHSLRPLVDLPRRTDERFALALDIHPDEPDLAKLREHGWVLLDPYEVAGTPDRYAAFVRGSRAELGIAKEGYVVSRSGWFGDRSAAYLASGRPVVAQDTGFGERLPVGAGLFAFADADDVLAAIEAIRFDYGRHARAARAIAEEHLDSRRVLTRLLREVGALPSAPRRSVHDATDAELAELLGVTPDALRRRPFEYRSSAPLVELNAGGRTLLLKDLSPDALIERARAAKPGVLHDPAREIRVYQTILDGAGLGTPALAAAVADESRGRYWLVVEKVAGTELYQLELERWHQAARWLARLHDRYAGIDATDHLVRYDRSYFELWPERAEVRPPGYEAVVDRLAGLPTTLVHGELYASNVLLAGGRVCVVDWELAGVGPGVLDLAALTSGLADDDAAALAETYRLALEDPPDAKELRFALDCARLHLALQWLGWSPGWTPPPEHALDWRAELPRLAARVGL